MKTSLAGAVNLVLVAVIPKLWGYGAAALGALGSIWVPLGWLSPIPKQQQGFIPLGKMQQGSWQAATQFISPQAFCMFEPQICDSSPSYGQTGAILGLMRVKRCSSICNHSKKKELLRPQSPAARVTERLLTLIFPERCALVKDVTAFIHSHMQERHPNAQGII